MTDNIDDSTEQELLFDHKPSPYAVAEFLNSDRATVREDLGDEISKGKSRIKEWRPGGLIQKPARSKSNFPRAIDFASDLIASNLAALVDAPVVWQVPLVIEGEDPSLFMPVMDVDEVDISNPNRFANAEELATTLVFEEWVLNTDDKQTHFCSIDTVEGLEFRVIDHGHTLLQTLHRQNEGNLEGYDRIHRSVGKNPYPFTSANEVEKGIKKLESVTDSEIKEMVDKSFRELRSMDTDDEDFVELLANEDDHKDVLINILTERRDEIRRIIDDKFS